MRKLSPWNAHRLGPVSGFLLLLGNTPLVSDHHQCANHRHDIGLAQSRIAADTRRQQIATALDDLAVLQRLAMPLATYTYP